MGLAITSIIDSISGMTVTDVTIYDLNEIPDALTDRDCPAFMPLPLDFVTDLSITDDSFGGPVSKKSVSYLLTWRFFECQLSTDRGLYERIPDMVKHAAAIVDAAIASLTLAALKDFYVENITNFGPVEDPSGNSFHGCDIAIRITEFYN